MRFLKFILALALFPLVFAEVRTLIDLVWISVPTGQWRAGWFLSFGAGFVAWLFVFAFLPRALWLYVLGHEFTHALAAMLAGGKVTAFQVSSEGGHIMTDRANWWITLSPYFVPIYALIWIGLWLTVDFYYSLKPWLPLLFFGIGLLWSFHLTFTVSMLHRRQTDLAREGHVFSGVVIALINLLTMLLLLSLLASHFGLAAHLFWHRIEQSYVVTGREIVHAFAWAQQGWQRGHE